MDELVPDALKQVFDEGLSDQGAFAWSQDHWLRWLGGVEGVPDLLEGIGGPVDRRIVAELVDRELEAGRVARAFVGAMIWGHGTNGYGPYRTAVVLTGCGSLRGRLGRYGPGARNSSPRDFESPRDRPADLEIVARLGRAAELVRDEAQPAAQSAEAAYRYLSGEGRTRGLGPAFFTKWMYFASAGGDPYRWGPAPILDELVRGWLEAQSGILIVTGVATDYVTYMRILDLWATDLGTSPARVEEAIFELAVKERANSRAARRRRHRK